MEETIVFSNICQPGNSMRQRLLGGRTTANQPSMMDVLWETLGFVAKAAIIFVTVAACAAVVFSRARARRAGKRDGSLHVKRINHKLLQLAESLRSAMMPAKAYRKHHKQLVKVEKEREGQARPRVFVLDFEGDVMASAVESLREEVSALLSVGEKGDEVVVRLESPGGAAHSYGLAASQLLRLKQGGLELTVCVDKIAASGGYMMACVAQRIIAAPFAILGSIGVAAPLPNANRLLDRMGVDYENATAGEYKRTISYLAPITEKGRAKFQEQLDEVHQAFKDFVKENRPELDIDAVATGEHWHGLRAAELGLANQVMTSDDYLMSKVDGADIYQLSYERPRKVRERLAGSVSLIGERLFDALWTRLRPTYLWVMLRRGAFWLATLLARGCDSGVDKVPEHTSAKAPLSAKPPQADQDSVSASGASAMPADPGCIENCRDKGLCGVADDKCVARSRAD
jgi:serine protease SohB